MENKEHNLQDKRCECCGYMTYHREHMGCIRAAEPVAWEYREFHDDNTITQGWGKWRRIESEEWAGRKVLDIVADIREFIAQGYRYELRALYTKPPAVPDGYHLVADATLRRAIVSLIDRVTSHTLSCNETAVEQLRFINEIAADQK